MQNYIVRESRARPVYADSVWGVIEDSDTGQKQCLNNIKQLNTRKGDYIMEGQFGTVNLVPHELDRNEDAVAIG